MSFRFKLNILIFFVLLGKACTVDDYDEATTDLINYREESLDHSEVSNSNQVQQHPFGIPITVMNFASDFNITVDYENLEKLFLHPEIKDRKVVTISIIGAYRKGKSFIMDYLLRFMYAKYKSVNNPNWSAVKGSWMGKPSDPLTGFSWKTTAERHTSGIVFWSDVFLYDNPNGGKYAIYLIDTQGLFDPKTPIQENVKIFALGTLISSFQIFNLHDVIQEDQLQYLQMATDYARFAMTENKSKGIKGIKAFQNLLFLMRDWKNVDEYDYGLEEGRRYMLQVLSLEETQKEELQEVRRYIQASFENVYCFLMPHPGFGVVNNKTYDGRFSEMDVDFRIQLNALVPWLIASKNLKSKKVFGEELTARKMYNYLRSYFEVFQMEAPEVESIYEATVNSQLQGLVDKYLMDFHESIATNVNITSAESIANLDVIFDSKKYSSIQKYSSERKMGSAQLEEKYRKILSNKIDELYKDFKEQISRNYKLYLDTKKRAESVRENFKKELESIFQANLTIMAEEIKQLEDEYRMREQEIHQSREILEKTKNEMIQNITNDHSLTLKEIENSTSELEQVYRIKMQQLQTEEQQRAEIYKQKMFEKQNEMQIKQQALEEENRLVEEKLSQQKALQLQRLEKDQAFRMQELKFQHEMEERRFLREKQMHEKEAAIEFQKLQFEKEMEVVRNQNSEKAREYQLKIEDMKQKSSERKTALEAENSRQMMDMQVQLAKINNDNTEKLAKISVASESNTFNMLGKLIQMALPIAQIGMMAAGENLPVNTPMINQPNFPIDSLLTSVQQTPNTLQTPLPFNLNFDTRPQIISTYSEPFGTTSTLDPFGFRIGSLDDSTYTFGNSAPYSGKFNTGINLEGKQNIATDSVGMEMSNAHATRGGGVNSSVYNFE